MESIDWIAQTICGFLVAALLVEWWRDHERVAVLGRYLVYCVISVALLLAAFWAGHASGISAQAIRDEAAVTAEWQGRLKSPELLAPSMSAELVNPKIAQVVFGKATIAREPLAIMSLRSVVMIEALWFVLLLVILVPAPARRRAHDEAPRKADSDKARRADD